MEFAAGAGHRRRRQAGRRRRRRSAARRSSARTPPMRDPHGEEARRGRAAKPPAKADGRRSRSSRARPARPARFRRRPLRLLARRSRSSSPERGRRLARTGSRAATRTRRCCSSPGAVRARVRARPHRRQRASTTAISDFTGSPASGSARRRAQAHRRRSRSASRGSATRVPEDLAILIDAAQAADPGRRSLHEKLEVPYANLPRLIFTSVRALLDPQIAPERRPAALARVRKYAGLEAGYRPVVRAGRRRRPREGLQKGLLASQPHRGGERPAHLRSSSSTASTSYSPSTRSPGARASPCRAARAAGGLSPLRPGGGAAEGARGLPPAAGALRVPAPRSSASTSPARAGRSWPTRLRRDPGRDADGRAEIAKEQACRRPTTAT